MVAGQIYERSRDPLGSILVGFFFWSSLTLHIDTDNHRGGVPHNVDDFESSLT